MKVNGDRGFTLIELILVIAIIGILSVVVFPRLPSAVNIEMEARRVLNAIKFAQMLSIASGQRYRFVISSNTTYQVQNEIGSAILLPGGSNVQQLTQGALISSNLPANLISFDSLGTPYGTTVLPGSPLASNGIISLSGENQTRNIVIIPQTGYGFLQ